MDPKQRAERILRIHYFILAGMLVSMVLLFTPYRVYGAAFMVVVATIQLFNNGRCPMTDREKELREEAGEKVELKFVQGVVKKVFGVVVPNLVFTTLTWTAFIASYVIVFHFLWNLLK